MFAVISCGLVISVWNNDFNCFNELCICNFLFLILDTLLLLIESSILLDRGVAPVLLQLLQNALCIPSPTAAKDKKDSGKF